MAVNRDSDKQNTVSRLQNYCATILDVLADVRLLRQEALDKGYDSGGSDPITDVFLNGSSPPPFPGLSQADLTNALTTIATLDTTLAATSRAGYKALERLRP